MDEVGPVPLWTIIFFLLLTCWSYQLFLNVLLGFSSHGSGPRSTFCLDFGAADPNLAREPERTVGPKLERFYCRSVKTGNPWWEGGILSLYNIAKETSGFYICTSQNKIHSASCNLTLSVLPPSMNIASTAGIIGGVAAALILLIVIIYCFCCRKKDDDKENYTRAPK